MRGCAGIAALKALRHPKPRVSLQSRARNIKTKRSKARNQTRKKTKPSRIQRKKNKKQENQKHKGKSRLCPVDSPDAAVPTWGILELPNPCHKRPQPLAAASRQRQSLWGREGTILERKTPERRKRAKLLRKTNSESGRCAGYPQATPRTWATARQLASGPRRPGRANRRAASASRRR